MNILYKNAGNILCIGKYIRSFYDKEYFLVTKNSNNDIYDISDILKLFDISKITDIKTKSNINHIDTKYYNDIIISFINYNKYNEDNTYYNFKLDCINNNIAEKISKHITVKNEIDSDTLIFKESNIADFVRYALNTFDKDSFNEDIYNKYTGIISNSIGHDIIYKISYDNYNNYDRIDVKFISYIKKD